MIGLAWRQFRASAAGAAIGLLALAAVVMATRPHFVEAAAAARRACGTEPDCPALSTFALDHTAVRTLAGLLVNLTPALIGAFWGAPLIAREYEAGTHRLVWAQSITRSRWLAVKLALLAGASVLTAGLLSALVTWWAAPLDAAAADAYATFGQRDVAPIGYALFACALGVGAGLLTRRTLPAMTATLAGVLIVRIVVSQWVRPLMFTSRVVSLPLDPDTTGYGSGGNILFGVRPSTLEPTPPHLPNAWIQSLRIEDGAHRPLPDRVLKAACPTLGHDPMGPAGPVPEAVRQQMHDCVVSIARQYHQVVTYQPAGRYWLFQSAELALFVLLAMLVCGYSLSRLRRSRG